MSRNRQWSCTQRSGEHMHRINRRLLPASIGLVVFMGTFVATYSKAVSVPYLSRDAKTIDTRIAAPTTGSGPEFVFVYIGAAGCGPSTVPELPDIVEKVRDAVAWRARASGAGFRSIGIAKDADARVGLEHLKKYGHFDEVSAGGGWLNTGALKYVFTDLPGVG